MSADYPQAIWMPAAANNYRTGGSSRPISKIVIHITDGRATRAEQTARWFQNPRQRNRKGKAIHVSAHYIVGRHGEVVQCVHNGDIAHHAGIANPYSIGIEHVVPRRRHSRPTAMQYDASAKLVNWLCNECGVPLNSRNIVGHAEADPNTTHRSCPNKAWDWGYFWMCLTSVGSGSFDDVINGILQ